ncbi:hypothetical protein C0J52_05497 [Blattella germanica]|nr:hypothetical protein C0J52_05497 [Blattella germanica]
MVLPRVRPQTALVHELLAANDARLVGIRIRHVLVLYVNAQVANGRVPQAAEIASVLRWESSQACDTCNAKLKSVTENSIG